MKESQQRRCGLRAQTEFCDFLAGQSTICYVTLCLNFSFSFYKVITIDFSRRLLIIKDVFEFNRNASVDD
jgi:hypothetical protein